MPRWLGHCVTTGRFQWDFLINQTNCKLLIRYNSSLTPQTLAHRYEKAILRINKNNKCIMPTLLFIIVSWKLIFLRWKCLKLRLFFFLIFSICFEKHETLNWFCFCNWHFFLLVILTFNCFILQRLCLFNLCFVFLGGVYFLLFKQPTGSFSINSEEATYYKSLMSTCCELIQEKCEYNHVYASINKINLTKCDIFKKYNTSVSFEIEIYTRHFTWAMFIN